MEKHWTLKLIKLCYREGNGNPLQYSCLENPLARGAWWATVHGVVRVRHDLATKPPPLSLAKVKVLVVQSCLTFCDPMDSGPPGSPVHGILQARILEWVAIPFCRGSSQPRDRAQISCLAGRLFTVWATISPQMIYLFLVSTDPGPGTVWSTAIAWVALGVPSRKLFENNLSSAAFP